MRQKDLRWILVLLGVLFASAAYALSDEVGLAIDERVEAISRDVVHLVSEALRIKSISEPEYPEERTGGKRWPEPVKEMLRFALDKGSALGLRTVNMDDRTGYLEIGPEDAGEMVMILGHLDTVGPSDITKWDRDPFSGELADGNVYGRGATDDKGPTMGAIYAMKVVQDLGIPLKHRVRLLFGTDEERPYWYGIRHYKENGGEIPLWGFTPDAGIALQEKGITNGWPRITFDDSASDTYMESLKTPGSVYNSVCDRAVVRIKIRSGKNAAERATALKAVLSTYPVLASTDVSVDKDAPDTLVVVNEGRPGHGAAPHGINAITRVLAAISMIETDAGWKKAAQTYLQVFPEDLTADSPSKPSAEVDGKILGLSGFKETHFGQESAVSLNLGFSEWTSADAFVTINVRYPHPTGTVTADQRQEAVTRALVEAFTKAGIPYPNVEPAFPASLFSEDHFLVATMKRVGLQLDGEMPRVSKNRGGATYIKAFPGRMMSFGSVVGKGAHGYNEYCTQESVARVTKLIARGAVELAGSDVVNVLPDAPVSSDRPLFESASEMRRFVSGTLNLDEDKFEVVAARRVTLRDMERTAASFSVPEGARAFVKMGDAYKEARVGEGAFTVADLVDSKGGDTSDTDPAQGVVDLSYVVVRPVGGAKPGL